eukprot:403376393
MAKKISRTIVYKTTQIQKSQPKSKKVAVKIAQPVGRTTRSTIQKQVIKKITPKTKVVKKVAKKISKQSSSKQIRKVKPNQKLAKRIIKNAGPKPKQLKRKLIAPPQKVQAKVAKAVKKPKKVLKVQDPAKEAQRLQKQRILAQKKAVRDQKMAEKLEKAKNFEITPREELVMVNENTMLTVTCQNFTNASGDKKKQIQSKQGPQRIYEMANCCIFCNNRELLQCIKYNDIESFKLLLKSLDTVSNPYQRYSVNTLEDILKAAQKISTGQANKLQFYFPIRQVQLSRGGKEGNNAFTYDKKIRTANSLELQDTLNFNINLSKFNILQTFNKQYEATFLRGPGEVNMVLAEVVRTGNFPIIVELVKLCGEGWAYGFNKMHTSAILQGDEAKAVKAITKAKLQKKALDLMQLTPMHFAAVNPDPTIFKMFFKYFPQSSVIDLEQRDLVHYAAANHNPDVLEFLIQRKCEINSQDIKGITPLMIACRYGRIENVKLLIEEYQKIIASLDQESEDYIFTKEHNTISNTQSQKKLTPLHYAATFGHFQIVKILVEEGEAQIDLKSSDSKTALVFAASNGHLEIVKYLLEKGAKPHGQDNQGKSPLIMAIINGHLHIVSYLLRFGVNPNYKDMSENSALHYACAYGWLHIVKYLIEVAGSDPNCVNEWKVQPVLIAMLKGHFGIVDYMVNLKQINASFQDDQGRTLISQLMMNINEDSVKNLKFLIEKSRIDCTLKDNEEMSPLHHLASNNLHEIASESIKKKDKKKSKARYILRRGKKVKVNDFKSHRRFGYNHSAIPNYQGYYSNIDDQKEYNNKIKELEAITIECAQLLIKQGQKLNDKSKLGEITPLFLAAHSSNLGLASWIIEKDPNAISGRLETSDPQIIQKLIYQRDSEGYHPFHKYFSQLLTCKETFKIENKGAPEAKFIRKVILPRVNQNLIQAAQIYAEHFDYDISTYTGLVKQKLDNLNVLLKLNLIDEVTYAKVVEIKYDYAEEKKHQKSEKDRDIKMSQDSPNFDKIDLLQNDPKTEKMGLFEIQKAQNGNNNQYGRNSWSRQTQHYYINENIENYVFDIYQFYAGQNTMKTAMHFFVDYIGIYANNKDDLELALQPVESVLQSFIKYQKKHNLKKNQNGFNKPNFLNQSAITQSLRYGYVQLVTRFVQEDVVDYSQQTIKKGLTFAHYMSHITNKEFIDLMFYQGKRQNFDINLRDKNGNIPLHYAAFFRNEYLIQKLLSRKDINTQNQFGFTPLHVSLYAFNEKLDHTPQVERILLQNGSDVNIQDNQGRTPIFILFYKYSDKLTHVKEDPVNLTILLTQSGEIQNINHQDNFGNTVLHYACIKGSTISALTLINNQADITIKNVFGNTPFSESLIHKHADLCTFLIQNGNEINQKAITHTIDYYTDPVKSKLGSIIIPQTYLDQLMSSGDSNYKGYKDFIEKNYTIEKNHPFHHALKNDFNGMSYLMLSKQADMFEVLLACIKNQKLQKFKDFLLHTPRLDQTLKNMHDEKKRNLLMLFLRQTNSKSDIDFTMEIYNLLVDQFKLDAFQQDAKRRNLLHYCWGNDKIFENILGKFTKQQQQKLLEQQEVKRFANPIVHIFLKKSISESHIPLLQKLEVFKYNLTYQEINKTKNKGGVYDKINFILPDHHFPIEVKNGDFKSHILFKMLSVISSNPTKTDQDKLSLIKKLMVEVKLNPNTPINGSCNLNPIQYAIVMNQSIVVKALLGYQYNQDMELMVLDKPLAQLDVIDGIGRKLLMLAIKPSEYGSYQNFELIADLLKSGLDPREKDFKKNDSFFYAQGNQMITQLLMQHCDKVYGGYKPEEKLAVQIREDLRLPEQTLDLKQESMNIVNKTQETAFQEFPKFDFESDAEAYMKQIRQNLLDNQMHVDNEQKILSKPDESGKFEQHCNIMKDHTLNDRLFDVCMTKIDVKKGFYGVCNFYTIQLIFDPIKNMYILWTRWGRIACEGQYQRTPFSIFEDANKEFKKVYKQKTGTNWFEWQDFDNYSPLPGKYVVKRIGGIVIHIKKVGDRSIITNSVRQFQTSDWLIDLDKLKCAPSQLTQSERNFIKPLVEQAILLRKLSQKVMKEVFLECLLDKDSIQEMKKLLNKIMIQQEKKEAAQKARDYETFKSAMEKIYKLTNKYYELANPTQFANQSFTSLDHPYNVRQEELKVQQIYDLEMVTKLLFAAAYQAKIIHPLDYCLNQFKVKLVPLKLDQDTDYKLLLRYINQSLYNQGNLAQAGKTMAIQNVYKVLPKDHEQKYCVGDYFNSRIHEKDQFFKNLHNHYMLFHGTKNANVLSILGTGLQIAPSNSAQIHGQQYGMGIYLADQAYKSLGYCEREQGEDMYLLVVEAALGNIINSLGSENFSPKELSGYHTLRVMGSKGPDFSQNLVKSDDATIWPLGKVIQYPHPVMKYGGINFKSMNEVVLFQQKQEKDREEAKDKSQVQAEVEKPAENKTTKNMPKKAQRKPLAQKATCSVAQDSDVEMIDTSTKRQTEEVKNPLNSSSLMSDENVEKLKNLSEQITQDKKYTNVEDPKQSHLKIEPNVINYRQAQGEWQLTQESSYPFQQSEYVVYDPRQIRVRYVVQIKQVKVEQKMPNNSQLVEDDGSDDDKQ